MSKPIEDYGFIGNMLSSALVGRDGSIDWLCLPRFDSDACFAALLGNDGNGHWRIAPAGEHRVSRRYRDGTTILETTVRDGGRRRYPDRFHADQRRRKPGRRHAHRAR